MNKRLGSVGTADSTEAVPLEMKVLVSMEEAAQMLSVCRTTVYHLMWEGEIETVHVKRLRRVIVRSIHDYVDRLQGKAS